MVMREAGLGADAPLSESRLPREETGFVEPTLISSLVFHRSSLRGPGTEAPGSQDSPFKSSTSGGLGGIC